MALTPAQKALCRQYLGWSFGFNDRDSHLEQSFNGLETKPDEEALVVAVLVSIADIDSKIVLAHKRLKARKVGDIGLNFGEVEQLRDEGNRFIGRMSRMLGVEVREGGGFSSSLPSGRTERGGYYPQNYIGK